MVGTAIWWTQAEAARDAAATGLPVVTIGPYADPGEVKRLRESSKAHHDALLQVCTTLGIPAGSDMHADGPALANALRNLPHGQDKLLAERDALLRDISNGYWRNDVEMPYALVERIKALSASAEPEVQDRHA